MYPLSPAARDVEKYLNKMKITPSFSLLFLSIFFLLYSCRQQGEEVLRQALLEGPWYLQSSDSVAAGGEVISTAAYEMKGWYATRVPSTVFHALVENGMYRDIFVDDHLARISPVPFRASWWYRTRFSLDNVPDGVLLKFDGINYRANVWVNGHQVADTQEVRNSFHRFSFDITPFVREGENVLAVEVVPPRPGDFTIGFVDWNPEPPDRNMGLWRPVWLETHGGVEVSEPFVVSRLSDDLRQAALTASVRINNHARKPLDGEAVFAYEGGEVRIPVTLAAGEQRKILFRPDTFRQLRLENPRLWWSHTLGTPHLYHARFSFEKKGKVLNERKVRFGIRSVGSFWNDHGERGIRINGKKIQIHGGGWTDRMMLDDTPLNTLRQLEYAREAGLNAIRLEGFWGNSETLYDLCDSLGILIMVGWSCQWEWPNLLGKTTDPRYGGVLGEQDIALVGRGWRDQIVWLRNHPAIFAWLGGSDLQPKPEAEKKYLAVLREYDTTRVYIGSAKKTTTLAGPSGVKMEGPYAYEPPVYWFSDTLKGGAYGFATEIGPGAQVPPLASIHKMLSPAHWWPPDTMWNFHCGRGRFGNLDRYLTALQKRYGKVKDPDDFEKKAQLFNYDLMRPMFEAYSAYRYRATGLILWMLNSAWPEMYWQLYDYYLNPNGAYYAAKKALQPWHVVYDYHRKSLWTVNDRLEDAPPLTLRVRLFDLNSNLRFEKNMPVTLGANSAYEVLPLADNLPRGEVFFLDTRLYDHDHNEVDRNFYWISPVPDLLDYEDPHTLPWVHTPSKQYADFTALNRMPAAEIACSLSYMSDGGTMTCRVVLENKSSVIAFFVHADILDEKSGDPILPVYWSDNYLSLLPHEKRILIARIPGEEAAGKTPLLRVRGYNLP